MHLLTGDAGGLQRAVAEQAAPRIYVVEDDASVRAAIVRLLAFEKHAVKSFTSAESFLEQYDPETPGCLILDFALPGMDGLSLQEALATRGGETPIIFLTGCADVPMTVQAMKRGAADFLTKPVDDGTLLAAVARALEKDRALRTTREERAVVQRRLGTLTAREHEVLMQVVAGRLNKQIASDLGTVEGTIKVHRARVMDKMRARSVAELVRLVGRIQDRYFRSSS
jgi:FixJ family two-component response regulator